jgi:shikimate kinase
MKNRRIVIVGFMGCGKTTVAQALARQLECDWIDLDSFIKEQVGRTPAEIIEQDGEDAFRLIETNSLRQALKVSSARVMALGGGAWTVEANRALVAEHDCFSVWLDAPFGLCWQRITSSANTVRPLAPTHASASALHESRRASYGLARFHVDATHSLAEIVDDVISEVS